MTSRCDIISSHFLRCLGCGHVSSRHSQVPGDMCLPFLYFSFKDTKGQDSLQNPSLKPYDSVAPSPSRGIWPISWGSFRDEPARPPRTHIPHSAAPKQVTHNLQPARPEPSPPGVIWHHTPQGGSPGMELSPVGFPEHPEQHRARPQTPQVLRRGVLTPATCSLLDN